MKPQFLGLYDEYLGLFMSFAEFFFLTFDYF